MVNRKHKIKHPEWLRLAAPQKCIDMFNAGILPDSVASWMIVTALRYPLRAVYGSNFRAALALLWLAVSDPVYMWWLTKKYPDEESVEPD